jgi:DNA polymerase-3 subunit delta
VVDLKPAYLISGDDDAKIDAWRTRVRNRAEHERGPGGLELFDGRESSPEEVAAAIAALTFDTGTRYLLVDDAGAWKAPELSPLETALSEMPPDTVLVLIVRGTAPKQLAKAVEKAGGEVRECPAPKPRELPRWSAERARELGLQLDQEAAKALVSVVGQSQQRISRELEKIALALHPGTHASLEDVEALASGDNAPRAYQLADALVAGDIRATLALAEELGAYGERPGGLAYPIVRRLREVHRATTLLETGMSEQQAAEKLGGPRWLAKRTLSTAKQADRRSLERALGLFAEMEIEVRGGGELDESSAFSLTLARATSDL